MSVNFTVPKKKNAVVSFTAQSSSEVSSSITDGDVKFTIAKPDVFGNFSIEDSLSLDGILEDVDIRFVASTIGLSSGAVVQTWQNSGKETGRDLSHPEKIGFRSDVDKPIFDIGSSNNPFVNGAVKFVADATADTHESKFLHFGGTAEDGSNGQRLTISGEFTMYAVLSFDKSALKAAMSPLWVYSTIRKTTNPVFEVLSTSGILRVVLRGDNQTFSFDDSVISADTSAQSVQSNMTTGNGELIVVVISRDSSGNLLCHDFNAKAFVNEKKSIGRIVADTGEDIFIDSFGPKCEIRDTTQELAAAASDPARVAQIADGDAVYLAEWGLFRKAIDSQKSAALSRLLKRKYEIA